MGFISLFPFHETLDRLGAWAEQQAQGKESLMTKEINFALVSALWAPLSASLKLQRNGSWLTALQTSSASHNKQGLWMRHPVPSSCFKPWQGYVIDEHLVEEKGEMWKQNDSVRRPLLTSGSWWAHTARRQLSAQSGGPVCSHSCRKERKWKWLTEILVSNAHETPELMENRNCLLFTQGFLFAE